MFTLTQFSQVALELESRNLVYISSICHMDDELFYGVKENQSHCSYSSNYLSIFCLLDKFVSHFSQELLKLDT